MKRRVDLRNGIRKRQCEWYAQAADPWRCAGGAAARGVRPRCTPRSKFWTPLFWRHVPLLCYFTGKASLMDSSPCRRAGSASPQAPGQSRVICGRPRYRPQRAPCPRPPGGYEESVRGPMRSSGAGTWFALTEPQCWWRPWQRCRLGAELTRGPQSPFLCLTDLFIQSECIILSLLSSRYCALNWESRKSGVVLSPEELAVSPRCWGCPLGVRSQGPAGLGKLKTYDKIHARAGRDRHFRVS